MSLSQAELQAPSVVSRCGLDRCPRPAGGYDRAAARSVGKAYARSGALQQSFGDEELPTVEQWLDDLQATYTMHDERAAHGNAVQAESVQEEVTFFDD